MTETPIDRFYVDLVVPDTGNAEPWALTETAWNLALVLARGEGIGDDFNFRERLWVSGLNSFDVRRPGFAELRLACDSNVDVIKFMYLDARARGQGIAGLLGITGVTLFFRPLERFLLLTVRGDSRTRVARVARNLLVAIKDSRRLPLADRNSKTATMEPMGVSTTDVIVRQSPSEDPGLHWSQIRLPESVTIPEEYRNLSSYSSSGLTSLATSLLRMRIAQPASQSTGGRSLGKTREWLANTWRDHTVNFVLTLVATILAGLFITVVTIFLTHSP